MREPRPLSVIFNFHPERCVGCGACVGACLDEHDAFPIPDDPVRCVYRTERTRGGESVLTWYSLACLHCAEAPCIPACAQSCFSRDPVTGTVQLDSAACVACHACQNACPYRGVVYDAVSGKADKCDGCLERLRLGLSPRCVEACPARAITVDDRPAVVRGSRERLRRALTAEKLRR